MMNIALRILCGTILGSFVFAMLTLSSCKHDPLGEVIPMPPDTTDMPGDTTGNPGDTTGMPCDPEVVYFSTQVLPILASNCGIPGCHDPITAEEDIILTDYASVMNSDVVKAFNLEDSDLFERITDNDPDKRMPPPPRTRLTSEQINTIATWILQGAANEMCDEGSASCDTASVSFSADILPLIETHCKGCHSGDTPFAGVRLENYTTIRAVAETGQLYGVTARLPGYPQMPFGQDKLPQCSIDKIKAWVDAGMPEN